MNEQNSPALWYVVHTKTNKELLAADRLEQLLHLHVFLPEVLQKYRGKIQPRPLFPNYLFVQADLQHLHVSAINHTPGVLRLVSAEGMPLPLREDVITHLQAEVANLNARGGWMPHMYKPGEEVRLREGPLQGLHAIFVKHLPAKERVLVLLSFLGQQNEVEVDLSAIERTSQLRRRGRTSRGHGRPIRRRPRQ
ncbi:MAG: hypothetical protein GXP38_03400 [Chloroflexi bacterium]|nr:hypothetical protein [Chloroflexota bacterium]